MGKYRVKVPKTQTESGVFFIILADQTIQFISERNIWQNLWETDLKIATTRGKYKK